jgi:hypothetical protein
MAGKASPTDSHQRHATTALEIETSRREVRMSNRIQWREHWEAAWHDLGEVVDVGQGERLTLSKSETPVVCANPACGATIPVGGLRVDYSVGSRVYCVVHGPGEIEVREE